MVVTQQIEQIRDAILQTRSTARRTMIEPTPEVTIEDDLSLIRLWDLLVQLERDVERSIAEATNKARGIE